MRLLRRWLGVGVCRCDSRLDGKTVVITGATSGIGLETVRELSSRGAKVIVGCRNLEKGESVCKSLGPEVSVLQLDLSSLASVRVFAERVLKTAAQIHILINNAGVACCPQLKTIDGFEMQIGVNHLGHFLLTWLLLERMKESEDARIINVSSVAHYRGKIYFDDINLENNYNPFRSYCQSKLANVLFTKYLANKLKGGNVSVFSLHPGAVQTDLGRHLSDSVGPVTSWAFAVFSRLFFKTPTEGIQTTIHCALAQDLQQFSGCYFSDCKPKILSSEIDDESAEKLWNLSMQMLNLKE